MATTRRSFLKTASVAAVASGGSLSALRAASPVHSGGGKLKIGVVGTGQIGKCVRFELDLTTADPLAPRSLIGKFPSDGKVSQFS